MTRAEGQCEESSERSRSRRPERRQGSERRDTTGRLERGREREEEGRDTTGTDLSRKGLKEDRSRVLGSPESTGSRGRPSEGTWWAPDRGQDVGSRRRVEGIDTKDGEVSPSGVTLTNTRSAYGCLRHFGPGKIKNRLGVTGHVSDRVSSTTDINNLLTYFHI